eukprot:Pompholyxophrys_sp_v1_NODE_1_length_32789_cov_6.460653.p31 type:complete len:121 gc:universal NODE_1_length_32789_cov_6.460653:5694-6056(+)
MALFINTTCRNDNRVLNFTDDKILPIGYDRINSDEYTKILLYRENVVPVGRILPIDFANRCSIGACPGDRLTAFLEIVNQSQERDPVSNQPCEYNWLRYETRHREPRNFDKAMINNRTWI